MESNELNTVPQINPFGRISEVAKMLGVEPITDIRQTVVMKGRDGMNYDVWEVVIAYLRKLEEHSK